MYAEEILHPHLKAFPKEAIFVYYAGRIKQVHGKLNEATKCYNDSIAVQSEWKQFHHICYWELMWCYSYEGDWARAYHYASVLLKESRWSRTSYMYLKACFRVMARIRNLELAKEDDQGEKDTEEYLFRRLPEYKQRIAGKSVPFEKFSIHKANKYLEQGNHLFLPGMELILLWNGFKVLHRRPDLVKPMLKLVQTSLVELEETKEKNTNYIDDLCLGYLLQGMCYRCVNKPKEAMESLLNSVNRSKDLVKDLYLAPFACAEVGLLYLEEGDLDQAKEYLNKTRKDYENHLLQSRLHFRIHSALQEIKHRRKQAKESAKMEKKHSKRAKNGVSNNNSSIDEDSISISLGGSESLSRQDSNSSFETAPEYSSDDERDLREMEPDSSRKKNVVMETTV